MRRLKNITRGNFQGNITGLPDYRTVRAMAVDLADLTLELTYVDKKEKRKKVNLKLKCGTTVLIAGTYASYYYARRKARNTSYLLGIRIKDRIAKVKHRGGRRARSRH